MSTQMPERLRRTRFSEPLRGTALAAVTLVVWMAGAAYCMGYERLQTGLGAWPGSLLWSAYGVLPWLALFEAIKRREARTGQPLGLAALAGLLVATGVMSLVLEAVAQPHGSPLPLQVMRRLPAVAATLLLLLLVRRERAMIARQSAAAENEVDALRRHAPAIRWIRAADNYLELHLDGQVWTRRITMREAETILAPLGFVRVHRSFIVNREHVESVIRHKGEDNVRTKDGTLLPIGKMFSGNVRRLH